MELVEVLKSSYSYFKDERMSRAKFKGKLPLKIASVSRPQIDDLFLKWCILGENSKNNVTGRNPLFLFKVSPSR